MERYAFHALGDTPIDKVTAPLVGDVLTGNWLTIPYMSKKVKQHIGTILDYAHIARWGDQEAPLYLITKGLPKQPVVRMEQ
jgi:hypothetical protein